MKQLIIFTTTFFISLSFFSCKKEKNKQFPVTPETAPPTQTYNMPKKAGSYWIYQEKLVDSLGNITSSGTIDSVYISGDSMINGHLFTVYKSSIQSNEARFERDSAGYIINNLGKKIYSYIPSSEILNLSDPVFPGPNGTIHLIIKQAMRSTLSQVSTPAGTFSALVRRAKWYDANGGSVNKCNDIEHIENAYYVSGIGNVREEYCYFDYMVQFCGWRYRELISYHIEP